MGRKAAALCRVSTDEQEERGTIQIQTQFAAKYADLHSETLELVEIFADDGVSGTIPVEDRPEGRRMLEAAKRGEFDTLLVYKLDRLGRSCRVILNAVDQLEKCGVTVVSMTEPFDTSNPFGRFVLTILAAVAEFERENILERTKSGKEKRVKGGQWGGGSAPYGYVVNEDGFLEPDTSPAKGFLGAKADVIKWAFNQMAYEGGTLLGTARHLNALGVPTRFNGSKWTHSAIYEMISNPVYKGAPVYGRRGNGEEIAQECLALVDEETWIRAQQQMADNKRHASKNGKRQYFFTGLVFCRCGCGRSAKPRTNPGGKTYHYYICNTQRRARLAEVMNKCSYPAISVDKLEAIVFRQLELFAADPEDVVQKIVEQRSNASQDEELYKEKLARAKAGLRDKDNEKSKVLALYRADTIDMATVEKEFTEIEKEKIIYKSQIEHAEQQLRSALCFENDLDRAKKVLTELQHKLTTATQEEKRDICQSLIYSITIHPLTPEVAAEFDFQYVPPDLNKPRGRGALAPPCYVAIQWKFDRYTRDLLSEASWRSRGEVLYKTGTVL